MNGMVTNFTSSVEIRNSQIAHSQNVVVEVRLFVLLMVDFASSRRLLFWARFLRI